MQLGSGVLPPAGVVEQGRRHEDPRGSQLTSMAFLKKRKVDLFYHPLRDKNRRGKNVGRRCAYGRYPHTRQTFVAPVSFAGGRGSFSRANSFRCLSADGGCDLWGGNPILCCAGTGLYSVLGTTEAVFELTGRSQICCPSLPRCPVAPRLSVRPCRVQREAGWLVIAPQGAIRV